MALWLIEDTGWLFPYAPDRAHCITTRLMRCYLAEASFPGCRKTRCWVDPDCSRTVPAPDFLAAASISPGNAAELPNQLLRVFLGCVLMLCIRARLNSLRKNSVF
jgi:hypothetical protein